MTCTCERKEKESNVPPYFCTLCIFSLFLFAQVKICICKKGKEQKNEERKETCNATLTSTTKQIYKLKWEIFNGTVGLAIFCFRLLYHMSELLVSLWRCDQEKRVPWATNIQPDNTRQTRLSIILPVRSESSASSTRVWPWQGVWFCIDLSGNHCRVFCI